MPFLPSIKLLLLLLLSITFCVCVCISHQRSNKRHRKLTSSTGSKTQNMRKKLFIMKGQARQEKEWKMRIHKLFNKTTTIIGHYKTVDWKKNYQFFYFSFYNCGFHSTDIKFGSFSFFFPCAIFFQLNKYSRIVKTIIIIFACVEMRIKKTIFFCPVLVRNSMNEKLLRANKRAKY